MYGVSVLQESDVRDHCGRPSFFGFLMWECVFVGESENFVGLNEGVNVSVAHCSGWAVPCCVF